jgi:hypothetical protein
VSPSLTSMLTALVFNAFQEAFVFPRARFDSIPAEEFVFSASEPAKVETAILVRSHRLEQPVKVSLCFFWCRRNPDPCDRQVFFVQPVPSKRAPRQLMLMSNPIAPPLATRNTMSLRTLSPWRTS